MTNKDAADNKLVEINRRIKSIELSIEECEEDRDEKQRGANALSIEVDALTREKEEVLRRKVALEVQADSLYFSYKGIRVTEHAIVQYLIRIRDLDVGKLMVEMMSSDSLVEQVKTVGDGSFPINGQATGRVVRNTLVTVFRNKRGEEHV